jgi:Tfp pilus assembly protein PilO
VFFLVLPKMSEVSAARDTLAQTQNDQQILISRRAALLDARAAAPQAKATIARVDRRIPSVADLPGLLVQLRNAVAASGLEASAVSPSTPTFDAVSGLSTIQVAITASGTYFEVTDFMYRLETFPRIAKVTSITTSGTDAAAAGIPDLTVAVNVLFFTSDTSAGPGSVPGPTTETPVGP